MGYDRKSNNSALNKISSNLNNGFYGNLTKKTLTFTGTGGDGTGSGGSTTTVATVTGPVLASIITVCNTSLTGTGLLSLGVTSGTGGIITATDVSDIKAGEIWHDTSPDAKIEETSVAKKYILNDNITVTNNTAGENITGGVLDFYILWSSIKDGGDVD